MPKTKDDYVFKLVKTLTKSEKRNFKVYVTRFQSSENAKFIQLFEALDKMKEYDEETIFAKYPDIKRRQLANLKQHLNKQILTSLRQIHKLKNVDIQIREQIDFAKILYKKGLYLNALRLLDRVKAIAVHNHEDLLHLQIMEFEKTIESRYITRSFKGRAEELSGEVDKRIKAIYNTSKFSNLKLKMYGLYIKFGHIKSEEEEDFVQKFFKENLPDFEVSKLTFYEKLNLYQCYVWYYYILQNFLLCFKYSQKWIDLLENNHFVIDKDPVLYIRGYNNVLAALFYLNDFDRHERYLQKLQHYISQEGESFDKNTQVLSFQYVSMARLNSFFLQGQFSEGVHIIPDIVAGLDNYKLNLDSHRVLVFYYKIACMYYGDSDFDNVLLYVNKIINMSLGSLREDIQCFARLLQLMAHYELGNYDLLEYLTKSVYRFLSKMKENNQVTKEILVFLRRAIRKSPLELKQEFIRFRDRLVAVEDEPYEKRSFLYLDILSYLEAKIKRTTMQKIIRDKFMKDKTVKYIDKT